MAIKNITKNPTVDLVIDTLQKNKQALVFVNSKKSAEKTAEDISITKWIQRFLISFLISPRGMK